MKNFLIILSILFASQYALSESLTDYVNPFIGTTNYGTTNPGAIMPHGMVTVAPFNVMGSSTNKFDKDSQWLSTGFEYTNSYVTGLSHNSLSGVGCPELGSLLLMPTTGKLEVDFTKYGSKISQMNAVPGNFSCVFDKYEVVSVSSATVRSGITEFTFPEGESNILFNLGEGLTNESGSYARFVSDTEIEGMKLQGTFCYNSQAVFPVYFVLQVSKSPAASGYWKKQRPMTAEAAWDDTAGKYKLYERYNRDIAGDDIGVYFKYNTAKNEKIAVKIGISYVSIANARENLRKEQPGFDFEKVKKEARESWEKELARVQVERSTGDEDVEAQTQQTDRFALVDLSHRRKLQPGGIDHRHSAAAQHFHGVVRGNEGRRVFVQTDADRERKIVDGEDEVLEAQPPARGLLRIALGRLSARCTPGCLGDDLAGVPCRVAGRAAPPFAPPQPHIVATYRPVALCAARHAYVRRDLG